MDKLDMTPEQQENGQVLKSMKFKFPVLYNGQTIEEIRWDKEPVPVSHLAFFLSIYYHRDDAGIKHSVRCSI